MHSQWGHNEIILPKMLLNRAQRLGFVLLPELPVWEGRMLARLHKKSEVEGVRIADADLDSLAMVWERFERFAASARSIHVIDSGTTSGIDSDRAAMSDPLAVSE